MQRLPEVGTPPLLSGSSAQNNGAACESAN